MTIAVGVLTHNMLSTGREDLFKRTVRSLLVGGPETVMIVDNGSTDGSDEYVVSLGGTAIKDRVSTCGHGMNVTIGACAASGAELVVFSNDDILWQDDALEQVARFWSAAPEDVKIASGLLEDEYPWNTTRAMIEAGGVRGLVRDTAPGGTWTLRARDWAIIGPVSEAPGYDDVPACNRLRSMGYRVCQLDLAEHLGQERSTWGNGSEHWRIGRTDKAAWGMA